MEIVLLSILCSFILLTLVLATVISYNKSQYYQKLNIETEKQKVLLLEQISKLTEIKDFQLRNQEYAELFTSSINTINFLVDAYKEVQERFAEIMVDKSLEYHKYNVELANLLNQLIPVSKVISRQEGWKMNRELNQVIKIVQQFQRLDVKVQGETETAKEKID